jgi:hypothetical protein
MVSSGDQAVNEMRADEASSAGDQGSHAMTTKTARIREMVPTRPPAIGLKLVEADGSVPEEPALGEVKT